MTRLAEWTMLAHGWRRFLLMLVLGGAAGIRNMVRAANRMDAASAGAKGQKDGRS